MGCAPEAPPPVVAPTDAVSPGPSTSELIDDAMERAHAVEEALRPVSLLTPAQIRDLQKYRNAAQLDVARSRGVPQPVDADARRSLIASGRLVELTDTTWWVVREMDYSTPLVTPADYDLLVEIGRRFHDRLAERGVPPMRFEITSALRTGDDQERLRTVNRNAASETTHQFGTTVDVTYASFRAPMMLEGVEPGSNAERLTRIALDLAGGRMALELKADLGRTLRELQDEGAVMVTYEQRQPVFHMTATR